MVSSLSSSSIACRVSTDQAASSSSSDSKLQAALEFFKGLNIGVQTVEAMKEVRVLDLSRRWVVSNGQRRKVIRLEEIRDLTPCFKIEDLQHLIFLENLRTLDVSWNYIGAAGAASLSMLTKLESLDVSWNDIGDVEAASLSMLTKLKSLNVRFNSIGDAGILSLKELARHANLVDLQGEYDSELQSMVASIRESKRSLQSILLDYLE